MSLINDQKDKRKVREEKKKLLISQFAGLSLAMKPEKSTADDNELLGDLDVAGLMVKCCAEIVTELVSGVKAGKDINLNGLKSKVSKKYKLKSMPRLVDIISAIPEQFKATLMPKLRAKPIRTASGVSLAFCLIS